MTVSSQRAAGRRLIPYQHLYNSSPMAKYILREFCALTQDQILPLSISHGIDFNHEAYAQDVLNSEPIHWCYNQEILERAREVKRVIALPHPWLMLHAIKGSPRVFENGRKLVIGPPPSLSNDASLLSSLERAEVQADSILVKARGDRNVDRSTIFWEAHGMTAVSAGRPDVLHYHRLMDLLLQYEYVISPVLSSVTILASALGCKVIMLRDYHYCSYSPLTLDFQSISVAPALRELVLTYLASGTGSEAMQRSRELLGISFIAEPEITREQLLKQINAVNAPLNVPVARKNSIHTALLGTIARYSGRVAFLKYGLFKSLRIKLFGSHQDVICKRINMIDAAINGLSDANFSVRPLRADERQVRTGQGADW